MEHWRPTHEPVGKLHTEERLKSYRSDRAVFAAIPVGLLVAYAWANVPMWVALILGVLGFLGVAFSAVTRPPRSTRADDSTGNRSDAV